MLLLVTGLCCTFNSVAYSQDKIKVAILLPETRDTGGFWSSVIPMMRAAADDLSVDLNVVYSAPSSYKCKKRGIDLLTGSNRPDYFVTGYWPDCTQPHLELAEDLGVKTLIINTPIPDNVTKEIGVPRGRYKQWIAKMSPADLPLGYDLANVLIQQVRQSGYQGVIKMGGLGGNGDTYVDQQRKEGLLKRLNSDKQVMLTEFLLAEWKRDVAYNMTLKLMEQNPDLNAIWAESDEMALGAIDAVKRAGNKPGKNFFIGGIDWRREALQAVSDGELAATLGGHFVEATVALILIYDYHHGRDFVDDLGSQSQTFMQAVTSENIQQYQKLLDKLDWSSVDFRQYSKILNPALRKYDFSIERLLADLEQSS